MSTLPTAVTTNGTPSTSSNIISAPASLTWITIQSNHPTATVFLGIGATATISMIPLPPGGQIKLPLCGQVLAAISATASVPLVYWAA